MRKVTYLNLREGKEPIAIYRTEISGEPVALPSSMGQIRLDYIDKKRAVQASLLSNFPEHFKALSSRALQNPRYSSLEKTLKEMQSAPDTRQVEFDRIEGGYPLVIYRSEYPEIISYGKDFALLFFGRSFDPDSKVPLKVIYSGGLYVAEYEKILEFPDENAEEAKNRFAEMNGLLKHRIIEANEKKLKKRLKKLNGEKTSEEKETFKNGQSGEV